MSLLELALTLFRVTREEWRGYALTATRDALVRVVRRPDSGVADLYATEGSAEWTVHWHGDVQAGEFEFERIEPSMLIEDAVFRELDQLARNFVAGWVWFATEGREEIAVERERYARYGYPESTANVRSARLHRMRADAGEGNPLIHSTLGQDELWVKDLIRATWAKYQEA